MKHATCLPSLVLCLCACACACARACVCVCVCVRVFVYMQVMRVFDAPQNFVANILNISRIALEEVRVGGLRLHSLPFM